MAGLVAAGWAPAAPAADRLITRDSTAANVTAHGGSANVVWARVGSDGRSRLVQRIRRRNRDLPVRPKAGLFDPDVGTSPRGNRVIVYTRCAGLSGRNCDVWQYDDFDRRERKVRGASSARCSEFAPSVWIRTVAFARTGPAACNGLYVARRGRVRKLDDRVPAETDLRAHRVAYMYVPPGDTSRTFLRVRGARGGRSRVVVTGFAAEGESYRVTNPIMDSRHVYWLQQDQVRNEFFAGRGLAPRRSVLEFTSRLFPGMVDSIAVARAGIFYTNGHGLYVATDPPATFAARD
ncbi:MAG: hypothetical protein ACRDLQ_12325 [Solirubrobacterales bacterium]